MISTWRMKIQAFLKDKCIHVYCHLKFLRVSIFILVLIGVHAALESSIVAVLITHLTGDGLQLPYAASIVNVQYGIYAFLLLLVTYVSDNNILGSFGVVVLTNIFYFSGLLLLLFGAWAEKEDISSLFVAAIFIALGRSGRDTSMKQFLEDQCKAEWQVDNTKCWRIASVLGVIVSICISWIYKDIEWVKLCKISVTAMGLGFGFFLAGIPFYHVVRLPQRLLLAFGIKKPASSSNTNNKGGANIEPFSRVEDGNKIVSTIPLWPTFLVYGLLQATASVFFYEQFAYMNPNIGPISNVPIIIFAVIIESTSFGVSYVCGKWREKTDRHVVLMRIGLGLAIAPICCLTAWRVEKHVEYNNSTSVVWLTPQFILLGILDGLVSGGIQDFFDAKSFKYGAAFTEFAPNIGHFVSLALVLNLRSLFGDSLDTSRLGLYYAILGYVCFLNFVYYCFLATYFVKRRSQGESSAQDEEMGDQVNEEIYNVENINVR